MALTKQPIEISFSQGLDLKTDPFKIAIGRFLSLVNTVFDKGSLLTKRNGYAQLNNSTSAGSTINANSNALPTTLAVYRNSLVALGNALYAFSDATNVFIKKGSYTPLQLTAQALIHTNFNQTQVDSALAPNGLLGVVFTDVGPSSTTYKFAIFNPENGQNLFPPTTISNADATYGTPRVFLLGQYFIVVYTNKVSTTYHLKYQATNWLTFGRGSSTEISSNYTPATTVAFDGVVANNTLYLAWNGNDGGGAIRIQSLSSTLVLSATRIVTGISATMVSVTADNFFNLPVIYVTAFDGGSNNTYSISVSSSLVVNYGPVTINTSAIVNLTSSANNALCTVYWEIGQNYSYASIPSNFIQQTTINSVGVQGSTTVLVRSVGLASKAFLLNGVIYALTVYNSPYQPTYFLINQDGSVVAKFAYQNAGPYLTLGLPSVSVDGLVATIPYLFKDLIQAVNKSQGLANVGGIYSQTGINVASFDFSLNDIATVDIGQDLHMSGGFIWMYDGYLPVEHNFFLYPDSIKAVWSATGGSIDAKPGGITNTDAYFYQVTYEWSDNQGNIFRSAPSIPVAVTTTGSGSAGSITVDVPTLRLTYKTANPVKIVIYRWSVAQQNYYQVTSVTVPTLNSTSSDSIAYVDTLADPSIAGNNLIYTTGGVIEDVAAPAANALDLFDTRAWLIDSEDPDLLWYSKQVIQGTPVEWSDLFTLYIPPSTGIEGSSGKNKCLFPMDDKQIIFKANPGGIYYINGVGPDNTGSGGQYSQPIFITSTLGCSNQRSIVLQPAGLMFQADGGKGIWLLGRDLSTTYIGADVETFNSSIVVSAVAVPGTNQIRFMLDSGVTLMYDYYYRQWGSFENTPAVSSVIYNNLHTYLNALGNIFQETPGVYLDGTNPVVMSFTTGWINLAGLQGFERAYFMFLLGTYISPHKLYVSIAYDYNPVFLQTIAITPDNFTTPWGGGGSVLPGSNPPWGSGNNWGQSGKIEQWRVDFQRQRCQSFQLNIQELYDGSMGQPAGAGLTISGLNVVAAIKRGYPAIRAANQVG